MNLENYASKWASYLKSAGSTEVSKWEVANMIFLSQLSHTKKLSCFPFLLFVISFESIVGQSDFKNCHLTLFVFFNKRFRKFIWPGIIITLF